ncbi:membrane protein [Cellulophaga sp. Hel_I_12]|uniref:membrane protein n=1 Tax=Cellulophaga sp. Hel_I_12 TaxID=1249972 RepID=UPI0006467FE8|nr:membrane protein [Cellulophaga sp. Hel_I_12]
MATKKTPFSFQVRAIHRYLGYFLSGIMAVYAISGITLIFRKTELLKKEVITETILPSNLKIDALATALDRKLSLEKVEGDLFYFENGTYNQQTGLAVLKTMEVPFVLDKMQKLHKASTKSPLYYLNIFFGVALLFFVLSAFWMYAPKMPIFKKGIYFALGGAVLTLVLLFV